MWVTELLRYWVTDLVLIENSWIEAPFGLVHINILQRILIH